MKCSFVFLLLQLKWTAVCGQLLTELDNAEQEIQLEFALTCQKAEDVYQLIVIDDK